MRKLKTRWFAKWAKREQISDERLLESIENLQKGLSSVDLGGGLYKVRVASGHRGKSSGSRVILVYREADRAVMLYGFMKKEQANLSARELKSFKKLAGDILSLSEDDLAHAIESQVFIELGGE